MDHSIYQENNKNHDSQQRAESQEQKQKRKAKMIQSSLEPYFLQEKTRQRLISSSEYQADSELSDTEASSLSLHAIARRYPPLKFEKKDLKKTARSIDGWDQEKIQKMARLEADKPYVSTHEEMALSTIRMSSEYLVFNHDESPNSPPDINTSTGSGCYIQHRTLDGAVHDRILTNAHVVADAANLFVHSHAHKARYSAIVEHVCPEADVAIVHVLDDPEKPPFFESLKPVKICLNQSEYLSTSQYITLTTHGYSLGNDYTKTEGHVTSVEAEHYANSMQKLPVIRTDACISPGNSGGPATIMALHKGDLIPQLIGLVFQSSQSGQNINSIIPIDLVIKVLEDRLKLPENRGIPHIAIHTQTIQNDYLRCYTQASNNQGLLVNAVPPLSCAAGYIREGDVLLEINGYQISERGMIDSQYRRNLSYIFEYAFKNLGETVRFKILRQERLIDITIPLTKRFMEESKIRRTPQNKLPTFMMVSGLIFTIHQMSAEYGCDDEAFNYDITAMKSALKIRSTDEVVRLCAVLPHQEVQSYSSFIGQQLISLNGKDINNIVELVHHIDSCEEEQMMVFRLKNNFNVCSTVVLRKMTAQQTQRLISRFQMSSDRCETLQPYRIDDYFEYQSSDGIFLPSRYKKIFMQQGPEAAMMDNYHLQSCLESVEEFLSDDEQQSESQISYQSINMDVAAIQALQLIKEIGFGAAEIALILKITTDRLEIFDQDHEIKKMLTALCAQAMCDEDLRHQIFSIGEKDSKNAGRFLANYQRKIKAYLEDFVADASESPEYESLIFALTPVMIPDHKIKEMSSSSSQKSAAGIDEVNSIKPLQFSDTSHCATNKSCAEAMCESKKRPLFTLTPEHNAQQVDTHVQEPERKKKKF